VTLFVDTSVWSLALRRDAVPDLPHVLALKYALEAGQPIVSTGLVLQELLQGFSGPKQAQALIDQFRSLPMITPDRQDHIDGAALRNLCRRNGVQTSTVDALLAQLCVRHDLTLLTSDGDFQNIARIEKTLRVWTPSKT
jgi:predicted nucleic acid-binding protein